MRRANRNKATTAGHARNLAAFGVVCRTDDRTSIVRPVCVLDHERNARLLYREYRILVQDACAHVGKLAQFGIGDMRNGQRIVHDAGVGRQKARHVRPVFVQVRTQTTRHDGSGNIAAAAVEQFNLSIFGGAVKARHDKAARTILGCLAQTFARTLFVQCSVVIEHHGICRVHERHVQKLRHHARGEVLSPADDELLCIATGLRTLAKQAELLADGI